MKTLLHLQISLFMCFIHFSSFAADDIALTNAKINQLTLDYEKVQISQAQGLTFTCYFNNIANFDHTGVFVNLKIVNSSNDTIYNENSTSITVQALSIDSLEILNPFNAPDSGSYTFIYKMFQDIPDAIPSNNLITKNIFVDYNIYQRDNGFVHSTNSWAATNDYYEIGNLFEVHNPGNVTSASVYISPNTQVGAYMYFTLYTYDEDNNDFYMLEFSEEHIIEPSDLGNFVTLYFPSVGLTSLFSKLLLNVGTYGGYNFEIGMSQVAPPMTSFYHEPNFWQWYYTPTTPMVRLHFDQYASNTELEQKEWVMYPNPTNDIVTFNLSDNESHSITISNVQGQIVNESTINSTEQINLSNLSPGIYFVSIDNQIKKLVKK